jgi:hypothetical protein
MAREMETYSLEPINVEFFRKHFLGSKSATINSIIEQIRLEYEKNPNLKQLKLELEF